MFNREGFASYKKKRRHRLVFIVAMLFSGSSMLMLCLFLIGNNASLYYFPAQVDTARVDRGEILSIGGVVVPDSLRGYMDSNGSALSEFELSDPYQPAFPTIKIYHRGVIPALLTEGQGVVTQGRFKDSSMKEFYSEQVLVKHDENYTSSTTAPKKR